MRSHIILHAAMNEAAASGWASALRVLFRRPRRAHHLPLAIVNSHSVKNIVAKSSWLHRGVRNPVCRLPNEPPHCFPASNWLDAAIPGQRPIRSHSLAQSAAAGQVTEPPIAVRANGPTVRAISVDQNPNCRADGPEHNGGGSCYLGRR